jgi:CheY-like chemotaxis protein
MAKILLIDDKIDFLENIVQMLRYEGYDVLTTSRASEGLQLASQHQPNLIICDFSMPELNGEFLRRELQRENTTAHIPFIFLSGSVQEDIQPGITQLLKPVSVGDLLKAIQMILIE